MLSLIRLWLLHLADALSAGPGEAGDGRVIRIHRQAGRADAAAINPLDIFEPESLIPLPVSDPSFALPLVGENPHLHPDFHRRLQ